MVFSYQKFFIFNKIIIDVSKTNKFERNYFEGSESHFSKTLGYDVLVRIR